MFCSQCGREINEASNFCSDCGTARHDRAAYKRLTLSTTDSRIGGVCGGIAQYLGVDPTVTRLVWVALSIVPGGLVGGVLAYLLAWIIIPKPSVLAAVLPDPAHPPGTPVST